MEKAQVLIVEDDSIIAMDIESRLKKLGYSVTGVVGYGEQAIEKVKENTPDLVLMDIILKGEIDGIEAADAIRTQFGIPIIFLTGYADRERLQRAKLTYPFGFIIKPFQDKDLEVTIEMALYVAKVDAERRQAEEALFRTTKLLDLIRKAQSLYIANADRPSVFKLLLGTLIEISESKYGFLDEVLNDRDGSIYKINLAISDISWDEESRQLYQQLQARSLEFRNLNNLSGLPALTGEILISNDPANDPRSGGLPKGHPPIESFMGMPLYFGGELVGVAGVSNREGGYTKDMADFLKPLLTTCASITAAFRNEGVEKERKRVLQESEKKYWHLFSTIPEAIIIYDINSHEFVDVNDNACELYGYSREEFLKLKVADTSAEYDKSSEVIKRQSRGEKVHVPIRYNKKKDGTIFPVEISSGPAIELGGRSLGFGIVRDLSEKKSGE